MIISLAIKNREGALIRDCAFDRGNTVYYSGDLDSNNLRS